MKLNIVWKCTCHISQEYLMGNLTFYWLLIFAFISYLLLLVVDSDPYFYRHPVKLVPILVGAVSAENEAMYGRLLAKYVDDPSNFFSISSDFCHWGSRYFFVYTCFKFWFVLYFIHVLISFASKECFIFYKRLA